MILGLDRQPNSAHLGPFGLEKHLTCESQLVAGAMLFKILYMKKIKNLKFLVMGSPGLTNRHILSFIDID